MLPLLQDTTKYFTLSQLSPLLGESPEATLKGEGPAIIPSPLEGEGKGEGDHLCLYYYETVNNSVILACPESFFA